MKERQARTTSGDKTICLPMPPDKDYNTFGVRRQLPCPVATITLSDFEIAEDFEIAG